MDCHPHRNLLWSAKATSSCLEEGFPAQVGASVPKLPSFMVQSRAAFDRKEQAINTRSRSVCLTEQSSFHCHGVSLGTASYFLSYSLNVAVLN